jgi:hypothetical protein
MFYPFRVNAKQLPQRFLRIGHGDDGEKQGLRMNNL